jgi:hypothetical protein
VGVNGNHSNFSNIHLVKASEIIERSCYFFKQNRKKLLICNVHTRYFEIKKTSHATVPLKTTIFEEG